MINFLLEKVIQCAQMSVDCVETGDSRIIGVYSINKVGYLYLVHTIRCVLIVVYMSRKKIGAWFNFLAKIGLSSPLPQSRRDTMFDYYNFNTCKSKIYFLLKLQDIELRPI